MLNYERLTELVHFKICELNFELVHVESELSQHWLWLCVSVSPTCTICVTDRRRRQARSVQSVFRRNTRLSASAFASDAFWTVEPLMTTAALNRPLARGDFSRVHTEVPPDTRGPKHTRFITQLSTINYHHLKSPSHQYITKQIEKYYNYNTITVCTFMDCIRE